MADVKIIDIDNEQWNIKDQDARDKIKEILNKRSEIINTTLGGSTIFQGKMKYIGEDANSDYYFFWWNPQKVVTSEISNSILIYPPDTVKDKIFNLNLNILQAENPNVIQKTQHETGPNNSGIVTFLENVTSNQSWTISGMGVLRRIK